MPSHRKTYDISLLGMTGNFILVPEEIHSEPPNEVVEAERKPSGDKTPRRKVLGLMCQSQTSTPKKLKRWSYAAAKFRDK